MVFEFGKTARSVTLFQILVSYTAADSAALSMYAKLIPGTLIPHTANIDRLQLERRKRDAPWSFTKKDHEAGMMK